MTIYYQTHSAVLLAPQQGLVQRIAGGLLRLWAVRRNRREIAMLASFNEHMLRDIGLTRSDVDYALQEPHWIDPSQHLIRAVDSRKRYRFRRSG